MSEKPPKKRVRKSGLVYRTYLTNRDSLENAPSSFKKSVDATSQPEDVNITDSTSKENPTEADNVSECGIEGDGSQVDSSDDETEDYLHDLSLHTFDTGNKATEDRNANDDVHGEVTEIKACMEESSPGSSDVESEFSSEDYLSDKTYSSVSEEEQDETLNNEDNFPNIPIYEGADLTTGASMLLIMTYVLEHNLSGDGFADLLDLISIHCKQKNTIPTSVHLFKQWFQDLKITPKKHSYCSFCLLGFDDITSDKCQNPKCGKTFNKKMDKGFFVEVPLVHQVQKLMFDESFRKSLTFRFNRKKKITDNIEDIYDGKHYMKFDDVLSDPHNMSFLWNTDGVPLFKSSKTSMWPLYFVINELPFKMRREPENMLLAGLWIGPKKPEMMTFLKPFIEDLELLENGVLVTTDRNEIIAVKGLLLAGTADLPAKCAVCNMMQYNGKYSCPCCIQPGQSAVSGKGRCQVFPFKFEDPVGPERTHEDSLNMAKQAVTSGKAEFGIKGPCWLTSLRSYDFVIGNCIDYMHCVLLGVTKLLISLWFLKSSSGKEFNVSEMLPVVDERLENIKPPLNIKRKPRSLNDLKYWKASELRSWLLFYAPVILLGILPKEHYEHFLLFSNAIFLLLKDSISDSDITRAENFLEHFVSRFPDLYEDRCMTLNLHLLLHLPGNVRNLGPLWAYSCFPFEDANGYLLKLVKGTQSVESQIIDSVSVTHGMPFLRKNCIIQGSKEEELLKKILKISDKNITLIRENMYIMGKTTEKNPHDLSQDLYVALANFMNLPLDGPVKIFKRFKKGNRIFHSLEYTRVRVRNSFTIRYQLGHGIVKFGMVRLYVLYHSMSKQRDYTLAIVNPLNVNNDDAFCFPRDDVTDQELMEHVFVCNTPDYNTQSVAIPVEDIIDLCVMIPLNGKPVCYVAMIPNMLEKD